MNIMLPYKAIIFDMDGVLCRTDRLHYASWVRFTDKYRLPFSEAFYETMLGRGREASMDMVLGEWGKTLSAEQKDALILEKNEIFLSLLRELTPDSAAPGVRETLTALRQSGVRLALGSSSKNAPAVIRQIGLVDFFEVRVDGTMISNAKPAPDIFLAAARGLGLSPSECLVVDDAAAGAEAACRGGFDLAGIGPSAKDPRCRCRLNTFSDLLTIFDEAAHAVD